MIITRKVACLGTIEDFKKFTNSYNLGVSYIVKPKAMDIATRMASTMCMTPVMESPMNKSLKAFVNAVPGIRIMILPIAIRS